MPKQKYYTVELTYVEKYSHRVVVKADSAKEARTTVINEFNNADYLYEKTTECPDETSLAIRFVAPGAQNNLKKEHNGLILIPDEETETLFEQTNN